MNNYQKFMFGVLIGFAIVLISLWIIKKPRLVEPVWCELCQRWEDSNKSPERSRK